MRCIILSCLAVLTFSIAAYATSVEIPITIQVQNALSSTVFIQEAHLDQGQLTKTHRIDLTNGYAQFVYTVDQGSFVELIYNGYKIPMYLNSTSAPSVAFDANRIGETLQFSGSGSSDNNFMAMYYRILGGTQVEVKDCAYLDMYFNAAIAQKVRSSTASSFATVLENHYQTQKSLLAKESASISNEVYEFYNHKANYDKEAQKLNWILTMWDQLGAQEVESAKRDLRFNESLVQQGGAQVHHPAYQNLLKAAAIWKYLPNDIKKYKAYAQIYPIIEQKFQGESRCYLSSELLVKVYEKSGEMELGRSKISQLQNACPQYVDQIMEMYGGDISGVENIAAADIDMVDKKGSLISLEDYRGKVVYISFWASWCKPCIAGFKKSEDIRKQLQDMGVVLINISIDKKEEAWRDAMIRHNPLGINTWAMSLQNLAKDYDISAIPLYHIVNKQGKFAYLSDQGGRDIVEEFRVLVEQ